MYFAFNLDPKEASKGMYSRHGFRFGINTTCLNHKTAILGFLAVSQMLHRGNQKSENSFVCLNTSVPI